MIKIYNLLVISLLLIAIGCKDDNSVTPNPPEVLLAEVAGDSVGVQSGTATTIQSITSGQLNFTDRDSARISFYYSGSISDTTIPFQIYYLSGPLNIILYNGNHLNPLPQEKFMNVTLASPRVSQFFLYEISVRNPSGFSYFKFRELKIYKK